MSEFLYTNTCSRRTRKVQLALLIFRLVRELVSERLKPPGSIRPPRLQASRAWPCQRTTAVIDRLDVAPTKATARSSRPRRALLAALTSVALLAALAPGSALATTYLNSSLSGVCNTNTCAADGKDYLYQNFQDSAPPGAYWAEYGAENDPGGYCVYYQTQPLSQPDNSAINAIPSYDTGFSPVPGNGENLGDYQVGNNSTSYLCGVQGGSTEWLANDPSCTSGTSNWCGGARWTWLQTVQEPWVTSGLTMSETTDPASAGTWGGNVGGGAHALLCPLIQAPTTVGAYQNFELCYTLGSSGSIQPESANQESIYSTPEQTGPCGKACATAATPRLIVDSNEPQFGTWSGSLSLPGGPGNGRHFQIGLSSSQLSAALNYTNYWMTLTPAQGGDWDGNRCGTAGQGYEMEDFQCDYQYLTGTGGPDKLIALEQDVEGVGAQLGQSTADLQVTSP